MNRRKNWRNKNPVSTTTGAAVGVNRMSKQTRWFLVSSCGVTIPLHHTMISLGKEGCDVVLQSRSVDQRHALVTYDHYEKRYKVKDLNSINGTYLNEIRIPSQTFVKLEHLDSLRFGFDVAVYQVQVVEQVPIADYRFRPWETGPYGYPPMKMADCQACLHKQTIPHTCGAPVVDWGQNPPSQRSEHLRIENPPLEGARLSQATKQDYCGNILPPHLAAWTTSQALVGNLLLENGQCCHRSTNAATPANYSPVPYSVATTPQLHSNHPLAAPSAFTCCAVQNPYQTPGPPVTVASSASSAVVSMDSSPTVSPGHGLSPNDSRTASASAVGGSTNNSLQSTFSGDSLDLTHDDAVVSVQRRDVGRSPSSNGQSEKNANPVENGPSEVNEIQVKSVTSIVTTNNANKDQGNKSRVGTDESVTDRTVMVAEKPYVSSTPKVSRPVEAEARCPSSNGGDGTNRSDTVQEGASDKALSRPNCMAFTIDFDDARPASASSSAKKLDIKDSISKFAPPKTLETTEPKIGHRRNLSFPKVLMSSKKRTDVEGIPEKLDSPTMGIIAAAKAKLTLSGAGNGGGGYHSEGHVSSDQEDDISAKSDPTKPATDMELDHLRVEGLPVKLSKRASPTKKGWGRRSLPVSSLRDSAKYLINKMFGEVQAPTNSPTDPPIPGVRNGASPVPSANPGVLAKNEPKSGSRSSLVSNMTYTVDGREPGVRYRPSEKEVQIQEVVLSDEEEDEVDEDGDEDGGGADDVCSEAGTYTIEHDQGDATEETEARRNIDSVFGVTGDHHLQRPVVDDNEVGESPPVELRSKRIDSAPGRPSAISQKGTPGWLKEWVALTASTSSESPPEVSRSLGRSPGTGRMDENRPRRKLPVPPIDQPAIGPSRSSFSLPSGSPLDRAPEKLRASSSSTSPEGRRSDSSMDTETILKETETVVSAMEARMDHQRQSGMGVMGVSVESRDSGGESDVDTSTASVNNDADGRSTSKQTGGPLKLLSNRTTHGRSLPPPPQSSREGGRATPSSEYLDNSEVETASVHSDVSSSSDLSGSSPGSSKRKTGEKQPLMRFNRAFSLRRARLGCDSDGSTHSAPPVSKAQLPPPPPPSSSSRPGSAGSSRSGDRARRGSASSGASASSVPPVKGPPSTAANAAAAFSRADGGRFSLRLPRGPPPLIKSATKNQSSSSAPTSRSKAVNVPPQKATSVSTAPPRSNSTLSAKELEMKNWKRRKGYDPMKAAAEGRKKEAAKKAAGMSKSEILSPTTSSFQRSASFHGTDGLVQLRRNTFTSEDDVGLSVAEASATGQQQRHTISDPPNVVSDNDIGLRGRIRKSSEDESTSEAIRAYSHTDLTADAASTSPRGSPMLHPVHRHKIEALDNLVISTVHQVSCNLRNSTEGILKKLGEVHGNECHRTLGADGLQDLLARVSNLESPVLSPQNRSVSRQLSGILKNMKRLEESLQAIDKVLDAVPHADPGRVTERVRKDLRNGSERASTCSSASVPHTKWNGFPRA